MSLPTTTTENPHDPWELLRVSSVVSARWVAFTVLSVNALLLGVGLLLVVRRFEGAIDAELGYLGMLLTALVTSVLAIAGRFTWRRMFPVSVNGDSPRWCGVSCDVLVGWGSSLALIFFAVGTSYPGDRTFALVIWVPILMADQFLRQSFFDTGIPGFGVRDTAAADDVGIGDSTGVASDGRDEVVQQVYRLKNEEGVEVVYGTFRADFQAGQRHATLHAAFCPPLAFLPQVYAEPYAGPAAQVKVAQAVPHGTRLEVKLDQAADEPCSVLIDLAALPQ